MRPLEQAQAEVLRTVPALETTVVGVFDALGLVLAEPVVAPHDVPPFTNSAMDGYAVRAADVASTPVTLQVVEDVAAGHVATTAVEPGTAIKIMTGAPLPRGADAIVRVEDTAPGEHSVRVDAAVSEGTAVRAAGGDLVAGAEVFERGTRLTARHLAVLASLGVAPLVRRRPRVAILSTGDEVLPPESTSLAPGQIRDTNRVLLSALLSDLGAEVVDLGIVGDDANVLEQALHAGARDADVVMTSGGVSMGEYDLVKQVLGRLGDIGFWKVAMQPAKPFAFGLIDGVPLFGLPGNPVSVMVAFEQFARPALLHMMGADALFRPQVRGLMGESVSTDPEKTVFLRASVSWDETAPVAHLSGGQSSNVLSALAAADAFAVVPRGAADVEAGEAVILEMFDWPERRTASEAGVSGG